MEREVVYPAGEPEPDETLLNRGGAIAIVADSVLLFHRELHSSEISILVIRWSVRVILNCWHLCV